MTPPTGPNWQDCFHSRSECQGKLHAKIDANHTAVMKALAELNEKQAYSNGRAEGAHESAQLSPVQSRGGTLKRFSWEKVGAAIIIVMSAVFAGFAAMRDQGMSRNEIVQTVRAVLQERVSP